MGFFEKAKEFGAKAADQAGDLAEIGKLKAKIAKKKGDIKDLYRDLGKYVYETAKETEADEERTLPIDKINDYISAIDGSFDEITILEDKIEKVKNDEE